MNLQEAINYIKRTAEHLLYILLVAVLLWAVISTMIQAFKCPELSQTELLLHIPKSFICAWEHCN
jgi:acyl-ACP thioesterase